MRSRFLAVSLLLIFYVPVLGLAAEDDVPKEEVVKHNGRFGIGAGIPYGGVGANLEININDYFVLTGGAGLIKGYLSTIGGLRIYMFSANNYFRPRISLYAGNVGIIENQGWNHTEKYDGLSGSAVGIGFDRKITDNISIDFDILRVFFQTPERAVVHGGNIKIAAGINYHYADLRNRIK